MEATFTYLLEVETEEGEYELSAAKYRSPVLCVKVDGESAAISLFLLTGFRWEG